MFLFLATQRSGRSNPSRTHQVKGGGPSAQGKSLSPALRHGEQPTHHLQGPGDVEGGEDQARAVVHGEVLGTGGTGTGGGGAADGLERPNGVGMGGICCAVCSFGCANEAARLPSMYIQKDAASDTYRFCSFISEKRNESCSNSGCCCQRTLPPMHIHCQTRRRAHASPTLIVCKCLVWPGVLLVLTTCSPLRQLMMLDLPTLGWPTIPNLGRADSPPLLAGRGRVCYNDFDRNVLELFVHLELTYPKALFKLNYGVGCSGQCLEGWRSGKKKQNWLRVAKSGIKSSGESLSSVSGLVGKTWEGKYGVHTILSNPNAYGFFCCWSCWSPGVASWPSSPPFHQCGITSRQASGTYWWRWRSNSPAKLLMGKVNGEGTVCAALAHPKPRCCGAGGSGPGVTPKAAAL